MLTTANNDPNSPLSGADVARLRNECDDVRTYSEAGWFCVLGYLGDRRLVNAHCRSRRDYEIAMGLYRQGGFGHYSDGSASGYLVKAVAVDPSGEPAVGGMEAFFASEDPFAERASILEAAEEVFGEPQGERYDKIRLQRIFWDELPRRSEVIAATPEVSRTPW